MADCRAKKSGLGYAVEKKMEDNYDREEAEGIPQNLVSWINAVGEKSIEGYTKMAQSDWKSFCDKLKDGVLLCQLINVLLKSEQKPPIKFSSKVHGTFVAMENIQKFNKGCVSYGMKEEGLFQSVDLCEGRKGPFYNVICSLHSLAMLANDKKFTPGYSGEIRKYLDRD